MAYPWWANNRRGGGWRVETETEIGKGTEMGKETETEKIETETGTVRSTITT